MKNVGCWMLDSPGSRQSLFEQEKAPGVWFC